VRDHWSVLVKVVLRQKSGFLFFTTQLLEKLANFNEKFRSYNKGKALSAVKNPLL